MTDVQAYVVKIVFAFENLFKFNVNLGNPDYIDLFRVEAGSGIFISPTRGPVEAHPRGR